MEGGLTTAQHESRCVNPRLVALVFQARLLATAPLSPESIELESKPGGGGGSVGG